MRERLAVALAQLPAAAAAWAAAPRLPGPSQPSSLAAGSAKQLRILSQARPGPVLLGMQVLKCCSGTAAISELKGVFGQFCVVCLMWRAPTKSVAGTFGFYSSSDGILFT